VEFGVETDLYPLYSVHCTITFDQLQWRI